MLAIAAVVVFAGNKPGGASSVGGAATGHVNPALAPLIAQVTGVPVSTSDAAGDGTGQVMGILAPVTGAPLAANGKPEVFYVGEEFWFWLRDGNEARGATWLRAGRAPAFRGSSGRILVAAGSGAGENNSHINQTELVELRS